MSFFYGDIKSDEIQTTSSIKIKEISDAPDDTEAYGQLWVKTATPNELYFTTDAGDDIQITSGTGMAGSSGATQLSGLSDVKIDESNFTDGFLIQTNSDGSAPTTGTLSSANNNIGIGKNVLKSLTSGDYNLVLGGGASSTSGPGSKITSGHSNIILGKDAGENIVTGYRNIAIGNDSLTGSHEIPIDAGEYNICIGEDSGSGLAGDCDNNIGIGGQNLIETPVVHSGTAQAGNSTTITLATDASSNNSEYTNHRIYISGGTGSDQKKSISSYNGTSKVLTISGSWDTAPDATSQYKIFREQNSNVCIGYQSGKNNLGNYHICIGSYSGNDMSNSSEYNTFIGMRSGDANSGSITGSGNIGIGPSSCYNLTSGINNTCVGRRAGYDLTTGQSNTLIGYDAGDLLTSGYQNTLIGHSSGDLLTTGYQNTIIGSSSDPSANDATNQTVIGYNATGQGDNTVTLGNSSVTNIYMAQDSGAAIHCNTIELGNASDTTIARSSAGVVTIEGNTIRTGTVAVANGGTGQTSYTDGQLLIGNTTGNTLTAATLTAGSGISITNGNGSITIASSVSLGSASSEPGNDTGSIGDMKLVLDTTHGQDYYLYVKVTTGQSDMGNWRRTNLSSI